MPRKRLDQIDLNLLFTLRSFVENGGVAQTARALGRSQPAISARLHQLEDELGVRLLERVGRRLQLTPLGRAVDDDVRGLVEGASRILDRTRASDTEAVGVVRIGALPTIGVYVLAPLLSAFARKHPRAEIELQYGSTPIQLEQLAQGQLDMVVSVGQRPTKTPLKVTSLREVTPVLTFHKSTEKIPKGKIRIKRLLDMDHVSFGHVGDPFFDAVWTFIEQHGIGRKIRFRVSHIQTLKALILSGSGVSILPDYTVTEPMLDTRRVDGLEFKHSMWAAVRHSAYETPLIAELGSLLSRHAPNLPKASGRGVRAPLA